MELDKTPFGFIHMVLWAAVQKTDANICHFFRISSDNGQK